MNGRITPQKEKHDFATLALKKNWHVFVGGLSDGGFKGGGGGGGVSRSVMFSSLFNPGN